MKKSTVKLAIPAFFYSLFSFFSKITGYIRDLFLALFLGTSTISDIFFIAFRLPNSFRRALSEETFNPAYIPIYGKLSESNNPALKYQFTAKLFKFFSLISLVLIIIAEVFMPQILSLFSYGFNDPNQQEILVKTSRIMFPFLLVITLSSLLLGNLNANNKFAYSGVISSILNIVIVLAIFTYESFIIQKIFFLAYAVILGGLLQVLLLFFLIDKDFWSVFFNSSKKEISLTKFFKLYWPTFLSSLFFQLNLIIGIVICSIETGAVSYIYYSERLFYFPLTLIGIAISIVLVPNLSKLIRNKQYCDANNYMEMAMKYVLSSILPLAVFLYILSPEIVVTIFERGEFSQESSMNTSLAFRAFLLGLPAAAFAKVLTAYFFSIEKPKIALSASIKSNLINLFLMLVLFNFYGFIGIPLALSISTWALLFILIYDHVREQFYKITNSFMSNIFNYSFFSVLLFYFLSSLKSSSFFLMLSSINKLLVLSVISLVIYVIFLRIYDQEFYRQIKRIKFK